MFILLIDGMTGAGKSTIAKLLSQQFPRTAHLWIDRIKKFIGDFERGKRDNNIAREVIFAMVKTYLDLGISLIIEHPMDSDEVSRYENLANELGIHISKVQLYTTPELAYQRITERQKDKEDKVPEDRILRNIGLFEKKDGFVQIDTTSREVDEVVVIVSDHFKKYVLSF